MPRELRRCFRCGNVWRPRGDRVRICPLCKSPYWNTPVIRPVQPFDRGNPEWRRLVSCNRSAIIEIARRHQAHNPRVFGSVRNGTARKASDIDLLVTFEQGASFFDREDLRRELEEQIGKRVDLVGDDSINWLIRAQILAEAEPV